MFKPYSELHIAIPTKTAITIRTTITQNNISVVIPFFIILIYEYNKQEKTAYRNMPEGEC